MEKNKPRRRCGLRFLLIFLGAILGVLGLILLLQLGWAHRSAPFVPGYPRVDLGPILAGEALSDGAYDTLLLQTGLARPGADALLERGEVGRAQILNLQDQFWASNEVDCRPLFAFFTMEDRMRTPEGAPAYGPDLPALETGDVLVSFSTHSVGWRHGHAGVVVDAAQGTTLEAALIGTDSQLMNAGHWRAYSNFMVLRLRDMTPALQKELAEFCTGPLLGAPYHLTSGLFGPNVPDGDGFGVQCANLVFHAFERFGYNVDGDGGRLVTVMDLATSPLFEVVQVYGMDPAPLVGHKGNA